MAWDPSWERVFKTRAWGKYPPEELIRFIGRNFYGLPDRSKVRILDAGCGTGAASWFLAREGFNTYGIDGSPTAIAIAKSRLASENLHVELVIGDLVALHYSEGFFNCVVELAALQHNRHADIKRIVTDLHRVLVPGGKYFGILVASGSYGSALGIEVERNTYDAISDGPFEGKGIVHFFEENELQDLFGLFSEYEYEFSLRTETKRTMSLKHWIVTATK
jgi:SAM-dependent methyltransferase